MSQQLQEQQGQTAGQAVVKPAIPKRKRRFGDRYDGYRVRELDLPFHIIPVIMRNRCDSEVFFEETVDIAELEQFVRQKRKTDLPKLSTLHVVLAAMVRVLALRPRINRFVAGKKIFAHNNIRFSMTVKRSLVMDGEETEILPVFEPTDTLADVMERFNNALEAAVNEETKGENKSDAVNRLFSYIPTFLKSFVVFLLRNLDKVGLMPKFLYRASPFHSSAYITDVGSLGIDSVYHHLYEFGTTSCFLAIGKKITENYVTPQGETAKRKVLVFRFVVDERICDGYYYASAMKLFRKYIKHPDLLELPPKELPDEI
ncbi:MAG: 2-oxo acid dehydrogenase subunit E2 [Clostridia bacterium]|nr:2-oxo acid dehydrogenase subunit E2 [Clostridia bacterium]